MWLSLKPHQFVERIWHEVDMKSLARHQNQCHRSIQVILKILPWNLLPMKIYTLGEIQTSAPFYTIQKAGLVAHLNALAETFSKPQNHRLCS